MPNSDLTTQEIVDLASRVSNWREAGKNGFEGDMAERLVIKAKTHEEPYGPPSYLSYSISVHMDNHHIGTAECFPNSKRVDYLPIIRAYDEASRIAAKNKSTLVEQVRIILNESGENR